MLCIEKYSKYFKLFQFVFFVIILLGLSVYFMHVDLEKLFAEKTNISQSKESIEELQIPTITLCFINLSRQFRPIFAQIFKSNL